MVWATLLMGHSRLSGEITMKPSRISEVLESMIGGRWPVFVWGPPGCGKSSVVRSVADKLGLGILDIRASLLDPTDLRGIPTVVNGRAVWCPPSFLPQKSDKPGVLFFDELNAAPPLVQASLYQLTLDRRVGEYELPDGWSIVAAGNRSEDRSVVYRMPSALTNRFLHVDFEVDYDDWRAWAYTAKVHPVIIGFLSLRRELLHNMKSVERAFPTPRSWEMASAAISRMGSLTACADVLVGTVGEGAASELLSYEKRSITEKQVNDIIKNPDTASLPVALGDVYALVSYLVSSAHVSSMSHVIGRLLNRLSPEMAILLARDVLRVQPKLRKDPGFQSFIQQHAKSLL
jgi:AAA domain (dynein-related subfamily)